MRTFQIIAWVVTIVGALIGGCVVLSGVALATGAPQEAAAAAIGLSIAIVPYIIARAITELRKP